jgi:drug/metabolite transporter (DMT)-like permease
MGFLGIAMGVVCALLWGSADTIATFSARRIGTFKTTFLSQLAGFIALFSFGAVAFLFFHLPITPMTALISLLGGSVTGLFAALGYFYFYRALEIGPITLVSPLVSSSSIVTQLLCLFILGQSFTNVQIAAVLTCIVGVLLAATDLRQIRSLLRTPGYTFWSQGVRWALVATFAFGIMDFGIGALVVLSGWFLPGFWTRIFSICFLSLVFYWRRRQLKKRFQTIQLANAQPKARESLVGVSQITPEASTALKTPDDLTRSSPDEATLALLNGQPEEATPSRQNPLVSRDPEDGPLPDHLKRLVEALAATPPEAPVEVLVAKLLGDPLPDHLERLLVALAATPPEAPVEELVAKFSDALVIPPYRSYSAISTGTDDDVRHQRELSEAGTAILSQDAVPLRERSQRAGDPGKPNQPQQHILETEGAKKTLTPLGIGILLALLAGIAENGATVSFSLDTQMATTGIASAVASGYSLIAIFFGILVYHERLSKNQVGGIFLFITGLTLLAFANLG